MASEIGSGDEVITTPSGGCGRVPASPHVQASRGREVGPAIGRFRDALWMTSFEMSVFVPETAIGFSSTPIRRIVPEVA